MNHNMISLESTSNIASITSTEGVENTTESAVPPPPGGAWLAEDEEQVRSRRASLKLTLAAIAVGGLVMIGSMVWVAVTQQVARPMPGPLVADHNTHRIESVQADMPAPSASFLLRAWGAPLVTEVSTNLQCASARLVQGGQTSRWFGFSHPSDQTSVQMLPYQPAYLEVRIDPSIHSLDAPSGDEPLSHNVLLKTEDGQVLNFEVTTGGK